MATESLASTISDLEKGSINVSESKEKGGGYFSILIRPKMVEPHDSCEYSPQVKNGHHRFALCDVKLEDVLHDLHDAPLGLASFESYLHHLHSPENLYFIIWLMSYIQLYNECKLYKYELDNKPLHSAFETGIQQFILKNSSLEINLSSIISSELINEYKSLKGFQVLPPKSFEAAKQVVLSSLEISFRTFLTEVLGNTGLRSGIYAMLIGTLVALLGFLPLILQLVLEKSRFLRFIGLPLIFTGLVVAIGGRRKTCIVIYLKKKRKLFSWEHLDESGAMVVDPSPMNINNAAHGGTFSELLREYSKDQNLSAPLTTSGSFTNALATIGTLWGGQLIDSSSSALFQLRQNQIMKRTVAIAAGFTLAIALVFGLVPSDMLY